MKKPLPHLNKWLLWTPAVAMVELVFWCYPRDLNLSQVKSRTIKNDKGQPAQLLWWTPIEGVEVMQAPRKGDNVDGYIMPADWWMPGRCFKVAELGNGTQGQVKVYLDPEDHLDGFTEEDRTFLARPQDLSPTISATRFWDEWSERYLSLD